MKCEHWISTKILTRMRRTRKAKWTTVVVVSLEVTEGSGLWAVEDRLEDRMSELFWKDSVEDKFSWDSVRSVVDDSWLSIELVMICTIFVVLGVERDRRGFTVTDSRSWPIISWGPVTMFLVIPVSDWRLSYHSACRAGRPADPSFSPPAGTPGQTLRIHSSHNMLNTATSIRPRGQFPDHHHHHHHDQHQRQHHHHYQLNV